jgi:hypothetical protein
MKHLAWILSAGLVLSACGLAAAQEVQKLPAITKVEIGPSASLLVNGKPFFPIMAWIQSPGNFSLLKELNFNTNLGYYWAPDAKAPDKDPGLDAYAEKSWQANLYFAPGFSDKYPRRGRTSWAGSRATSRTCPPWSPRPPSRPART